MSITTTAVVSPGRDTFSIPGAHSAQQITAMFGADLGLGNMESSVTESDGVRTITFRHKSGDKGINSL
jgi:hypothetical protein